jgi:hypothetical protein
MKFLPLFAAAAMASLCACNDAPKPKAEAPKAPQKLGENPVAAPLDYIAAVGKAQKASLGRLETAKLIDAIQKFEASESRPPKDLSELVPGFLPALPPAPAGMKLEYKAADGSFLFVPLAPPAGEKK